MLRLFLSLTVLSAAVSAARACDANPFLSEVQDYNSGKYEEAVQMSAASIAAYPRCDQAQYYRALALSKLDRMDEAQTAYQNCAAITKDARLKDYCEAAISVLDIDYNKNKEQESQSGMWENGQFRPYSYSEIQEFRGRDTLVRRQAAHDIEELNINLDNLRNTPMGSAKYTAPIVKQIEARKERMKQDLFAIPQQFRESPSNE